MRKGNIIVQTGKYIKKFVLPLKFICIVFAYFFVVETVFLSDIDTDIETQIEIKYYTVEGRHDFQPCVSDGKFP